MQPGVVGKALARLQARLQPGCQGLIGHVARREKRGVDLLDDLQGVAAVDEDGGFLQQDAGKAGRALEAGEPGQPLGCGRDVLALVLVAAWYPEAPDPAPGAFPAAGGKADGRLSSGDAGIASWRGRVGLKWW